MVGLQKEEREGEHKQGPNNKRAGPFEDHQEAEIKFRRFSESREHKAPASEQYPMGKGEKARAEDAESVMTKMMDEVACS